MKRWVWVVWSCKVTKQRTVKPLRFYLFEWYLSLTPPQWQTATYHAELRRVKSSHNAPQVTLLSTLWDYHYPLPIIHTVWSPLTFTQGSQSLSLTSSGLQCALTVIYCKSSHCWSFAISTSPNLSSPELRFMARTVEEVFFVLRFTFSFLSWSSFA